MCSVGGALSNEKEFSSTTPSYDKPSISKYYLKDLTGCIIASGTTDRLMIISSPGCCTKIDRHFMQEA